MERNKKRRIIRYLAYLALVTTLITSSTLARYAFQGGLDVKNQVAAFATGSQINFNMPLDDMAPNSSKEVTFSVVNYEGSRDSEVVLEYDVQVETTGNLPLTFSLAGPEGFDASGADNQLVEEGELALVSDGARKKGTATGGRLPIGERVSHDYRLIVSWPVTDEAADYSNEIDMLTVTVSSRQAAQAS